MYKKIDSNNNFYKNIIINNIEFKVHTKFRKKRGITYYVREKSIIVYASKYYSYDYIMSLIYTQSDKIYSFYINNIKKIDYKTYEKVLNKEEYLFLGSFQKVEGDFIPYKEYFKKFAHILEDIYSIIMNKIGKSGTSLLIKPMNSRWGSYNAKRNTITLNLYLLFFDKTLIESVIYHEICHIGNLSHNRKFHTDLDALDPKNREFRKKINELTPLVKKLQELD